jgi:hypothetical protein
MAELTLWFFGIYSVIRLVVLWFDLKGKAWALWNYKYVPNLKGFSGGWAEIICHFLVSPLSHAFFNGSLYRWIAARLSALPPRLVS